MTKPMHEDTEALINQVYEVLPPVMANHWAKYSFWVQVTYLKRLREIFSQAEVTSAEVRR